MTGFDRDGNSDSVAGGSYDAYGFSTVTPFYHKVTGTAYNVAGFDSTGYHENGTLYDNDGLDKEGNTEDAAATYGTVTLGTGTADETVASRNSSNGN